VTDAIRVVFLTHSGADSGAEQSIVTYLSQWPAERGRPLLVLGGAGAIEDRARSLGVDHVVEELAAGVASTRRSERSANRVLGAVTGLLRHSKRVRVVLRDRSADVVVTIGFKALVFGWLAARRTGATVVWSLHDRVSRDYFPWFMVPVLRYLAPRLVDGLMVNSGSTLSTVRPGRTPVLVATPAVVLDPRDFHEPADEVRKVVMIGRLSPWKGQDLFVRAFAAAFEGSSAQAYIVGGALFGEHDYEKALHDLVRELGLADRVHFVGHVSDPWDTLVDADVLVHCSRIPEPFGQVVVQGLWARCAVVATKPGGPAEVVTDGLDGLLVPCGNQEALRAALSRLRDDRELRRRLAREGRATAAGYNASAMGPSLEAWLSDLRKGRLAGRSVRRTLPAAR
jgi:glycosyltransferase involved in cell wall biosynthesis